MRVLPTHKAAPPRSLQVEFVRQKQSSRTIATPSQLCPVQFVKETTRLQVSSDPDFSVVKKFGSDGPQC